MNKKTFIKGFTLVEVLVAVGIVVTLTGIVVTSMSQARSNTRDKVRMSDLAQIQLALRLYADQNGAYPVDTDGAVIGNGGSLDTLLAPYLPSIPKDPSHDISLGSDSFAYIYDSSAECTNDNETSIILYAQSMENEGMANFVSSAGSIPDGVTCNCVSGCGFNMRGTPDGGYAILID